MREEALPIREARASDLNQIMALIRLLAQYEKAPEEVAVDEKQLLGDWQKGLFQLLVLEAPAEKELAGMALFYPRYSTWKGACYYLEDLYVLPQYRGQGWGTALLQAVAQKAREAGACRLDWQVLDWNSSAIKLYEKLGAQIEKEWWNCKWWL